MTKSSFRVIKDQNSSSILRVCCIEKVIKQYLGRKEQSLEDLVSFKWNGKTKPFISFLSFLIMAIIMSFLPQIKKKVRGGKAVITTLFLCKTNLHHALSSTDFFLPSHVLLMQGRHAGASPLSTEFNCIAFRIVVFWKLYFSFA